MIFSPSPPSISFDAFSRVLRAYVAAHENAEAFYSKLPRSISDAFFDNEAIDAYLKSMDQMLKAVCACVSEDLPNVIDLMLEHPIELSIHENGKDTCLQGLEQLLAYLQMSYWGQPAGDKK